MNTKEEVKRKQVKSAINYRRYYVNYLSARIQDLLKELREINNMPENIINERAVRERMECVNIEEQNRELSNTESEVEEVFEEFYNGVPVSEIKVGGTD